MSLNVVLLQDNAPSMVKIDQCWANSNSLSLNSWVRSKCLRFELSLTHFFKNERESSETQNFCEFWVKIETQTQIHLFFLLHRFLFLTIFPKTGKRENCSSDLYTDLWGLVGLRTLNSSGKISNASSQMSDDKSKACTYIRIFFFF